MSVLIQDLPQNGKGLARGLEPAPDLVPEDEGDSRRFNHATYDNRNTLGVPRPDTPS